jgi:hypothetical protein
VLGETNSTDPYAIGVQGTITSSSPGGASAAVRGINNGTGASGIGVWGSQEGSGYGLYGTTPTGWGVVGKHTGSGGTNPGVEGDSDSSAIGAIGVKGVITSTAPGGKSAAVRGQNNGTGSGGIGVWGSQDGSGYGLYGTSPGGTGVVGATTTGLAGYFSGNVQVTGTLSAAVKNFQIDDPLDPAHNYLQHSSVESSQLSDLYSGNVTTDANGFAVVRLPNWFQALNRHFSYQLTVVGKAHWDARAAVWSKIRHNQFTIRTDQAHVTVSWQVTGVRHDAYALAHPLRVVQQKPASAQGKYLHPELYGQPRSKSEVVLP